MNFYITVKLKQILKMSTFIIILALLLVLSETNFKSVSTSIEMFEKQVFPSLFPFILFTEIILKTNIMDIISKKVGKILSFIFKIPSSGSIAVITGFLCGFPMGAQTVNSLYEESKISKKSANYLLKFTNNCNPAFILSTIGIGLFKNIKIGVLILLSHYISSIIIGSMSNHIDDNLIIHDRSNKLKHFNKKIIKLNKKINKLKECDKTFYKDNKNNKRSYSDKNFMELIKLSIFNTLKSLGLIFGFIIIFNLIYNIIDTFLININVNIKIRCIVSGILEMTTGSKNIYMSNYSLTMKICLISFVLGFSGLSIIAQIYSTISKHKFSMLNIIKFKLLHGILSFIISYILLNIKNIIYVNYYNLILLGLLLLLLYLLLYNILSKDRSKNKNSSLNT